MESIPELAQEYKQGVTKLNKLIKRLKAQRANAMGQELYYLNLHICVLEDMRNELRSTASKLEHYYDK